MSIRSAAVTTLSLMLLPAPPVPAQTDAPVVRSTTQEVVLDLVVRDKKERFIRDLQAGDIEVLEDGVKQNIKTFRLVAAGEAKAEPRTKSTAAAPAHSSQKVQDLNLVSVVFERMSPKSRLYARDAAREFLNRELTPNTYVAVYSLDYRLNALQGYTNRKDLLLPAVERAATGNYTEFRRQSDAVLNNALVIVRGERGGIKVEAVTDANQSSSMSVAGAGGVSANSESAMLLARIEQKQLDMVTYTAGWRSLDGLLQIVKAQSMLPGRKTVLFLSEGIVVPWQTRELFDTIVSTANRFNVSIYCLDVTGLTTTAPGRGSIDQLRNVAELSANQVDQSASPDVMRELSTQDDKMLAGLKGNLQENMAELASLTGGFLIANTNDLRKPLSKVMEDVNTHYELAYTPQSGSYDGHFRRIQVKIARAGAQVQSRSGYYALPLLNGDPLGTFEVACLNALEQQPRKDDFELRVTALRYRPSPSGTLHEIVFEVPMKNITFTEIANTDKLRTHLSLLALIRDSSGQVVEKISRDLANDLPVDKKDAARNGNISFHHPFRLTPGMYTLDAVAIDQEGDEASVRRSRLTVPAIKDVSISNLTLVRRVDPVNGERDPDDPLQAPSGTVTPSLDDRIPAGAEVPLYFIVYLSPGIAAKPQISIELYQNGKLSSRITPDLPAAGQTGAIPVLTSLSPPPGVYEIRVHLQQGDSSDTQLLPIRVGQ